MSIHVSIWHKGIYPSLTKYFYDYPFCPSICSRYSGIPYIPSISKSIYGSRRWVLLPYKILPLQQRAWESENPRVQRNWESWRQRVAFLRIVVAGSGRNAQEFGSFGIGTWGVARKFRLAGQRRVGGYLKFLAPIKIIITPAGGQNQKDSCDS